MERGKIVDILATGHLLVSDGAWGTMLQQRGLALGQCPELWNVDRAEDVFAIAADYVKAGADLIKTNSFGANRLKLKHYGLQHRVEEINRAAAAISRRAAGNQRWVIASVGPTGALLVTGDVTEEQLYDVFYEQAYALAQGGADALLIETMSAAEEATAAVRAARDATECEVICTFTFEKTKQGEYRTMMGVSPEEALSAVLEAGADIVGANCGNGMEQMIEIAACFSAAAPEIPLAFHANAGLPRQEGDSIVYPETPQMTAAWVPRLVEAGAQIIGGCCGTTPAHIAAIRSSIDKCMAKDKKPSHR